MKINFSATSFGVNGPKGTPVPVDRVTGSFTITFDPNTNTDITGGTTITDLKTNLTLSDPSTVVSFNYQVNTSGGQLQVIAVPPLPGAPQGAPHGGFDAFSITIQNCKTIPKFYELQYSQQSLQAVFTSNSGTVLALREPSQLV